MSGKSFRIEERLKTQSGEENSSSVHHPDEEFSSPDCVFKRSSIQKDFPDISIHCVFVHTLNCVEVDCIMCSSG